LSFLLNLNELVSICCVSCSSWQASEYFSLRSSFKKWNQFSHHGSTGISPTSNSLQIPLCFLLAWVVNPVVSYLPQTPQTFASCFSILFLLFYCRYLITLKCSKWRFWRLLTSPMHLWCTHDAYDAFGLNKRKTSLLTFNFMQTSDVPDLLSFFGNFIFTSGRTPVAYSFYY
jgi:hypothetical protein